MMNPDGHFRGTTLHATWQPVDQADTYDVSVDRCDEDSPCIKVFQTRLSDTQLTATSNDFQQCTIYTVKVVAKSSLENDLLKETFLVRRHQQDCNSQLQMALTITLTLLFILALLVLAGVIYYHRRRPIQRLQRARSRVYSKLYPREKYERSFLKDEFVQRMSAKDPVQFPAVSSISAPLFGANSDSSEKSDLLDKSLSRYTSVDVDSKSDFLSEEFCELEQLAFDTIQRRTSVSSPAVNRRRNRYQDIVPFDATRVALEKPLSIAGETELSDFINASYISDVATASMSPHATFLANGFGNYERANTPVRSEPPHRSRWNVARLLHPGANESTLSKKDQRDKLGAFKRPKNPSQTTLKSSLSGRRNNYRYIAAQGPGGETTPLFWEMIWQQNIRVIVMLTKVVEGYGFNSVKCAMYWPEIVGEVRRFYDLEVQLYDIQEAPEYRVHKLEITKKSASFSREIVHIQCTSWPDRSAPEKASTLLQLIEVTRALSGQYNDPIKPGPWLVHCSAGVGRTGTFIAVDQLLRIIDDDKRKEIDIFNMIYQLRKDRRYMVQTQTQYAYVYKCVFEYLQRKSLESIDKDVN